MNQKFSLPQQSVPTTKLRILASHLHKFMANNHVHIAEGAKINSRTASAFSNMFVNVSPGQSQSTIETASVSQAPIKREPNVRIVIPQHKQFLLNGPVPQPNLAKKGQRRPLNSSLSRQRAHCEESIKDRTFNTLNDISVQLPSRQSSLRERSVSQVPSIQTKQIVDTRQWFTSQMQQTDDPIDFQFEDSIPLESPKEGKELNVEGSAIYGPSTYNIRKYLQHKKRDLRHSCEAKNTPNLPRLRDQIQNTLILKNVLERPQPPISEYDPDVQLRQSHMFIMDDRDRFGQMIYPKAYRQPVPGPGAYDDGFHSLNTRVNKIQTNIQHQALIHEWKNNHNPQT